ncbi:MAG: hypothetical protein U0U66_13680 [Cytophagaceae bacterium]
MFSTSVGSALSAYRNSGYELVVQAKLEIDGRYPEPDILLVKKINNQGDISLSTTDVIYIDIKLMTSTTFSDAQNVIVNKVTATTTAAVKVYELDDNVSTLIKSLESININIKEVYKLCIDPELNLVLVKYKP